MCNLLFKFNENTYFLINYVGKLKVGTLQQIGPLTTNHMKGLSSQKKR